MTNQLTRRLAALAACVLAAAGAHAQPLNADIDLIIDIEQGTAVIENGSANPFNLSAFTIGSATGLLDTSNLTALPGFEVVPNSNANQLAQLSASSAVMIAPGGQQSVGVVAAANFSEVLTNAQEAVGFGNSPFDQTFSFTDDDLDVAFTGDVMFANAQQNTFVLEINTTSGNATLINDSGLDVTIAALQINSPAGALNAAGYTGLSGAGLAGWDFNASQNSASGIAEFFPGDGTPGSGDLFTGGESASLGAAYTPGAEEDAGLNFFVEIRSGEGVAAEDLGVFNGAVVFVSGAGLPGDYNGDGVVNAADYTVWRDNLGDPDETAIGGNGDGLNGVDLADYQVFVDNFGNGGASVAAVPEPSTLLVLLLAGLVTPRCKRA